MAFVIQLRGGPKDGTEFTMGKRPGFNEPMQMFVSNEPPRIALYRQSDTLLLSGPLGQDDGPPDIIGAVYEFAGYEQ